MRLLICCVFLIKTIIDPADTKPTAIVLWHGMGDTCCTAYSLGVFKHVLEREIPGVYVNSLMIGNNTIEDFESGYFMNPNKQIEFACQKLAADQGLQNGFNAIGFSQGSQFLRGVIQRCGHRLPPVKNFITLGGQHQGVYGIPHCMALSHQTCDYIRELLNFAAYHNWVQKSLVQATYWHDPLHDNEYKHGSILLADINNELTVNQTYKNNLNQLEHFVMVKFNNDSMVQPRESAWFGFYAPGQGKKLLTLQESQIYLEDRLGLQKMDKAGKLVFLELPGQHLHFSMDWFRANIIKPYLLN